MSDRLDLNAADRDAIDDVEGLKGHGPEIVRYRQERGGFTAVEQLEEVPGLTGKVGPETYRLLTIGS